MKTDKRTEAVKVSLVMGCQESSHIERSRIAKFADHEMTDDLQLGNGLIRGCGKIFQTETITYNVLSHLKSKKKTLCG